MAIHHVPFFSGALYSRKTCCVYVPPGYDSSDEDTAYPVIYLLHGLYGHQLSWLQNGSAEPTLDRMIESGELRPCIVVMPDDGGYDHGTFYIDWYDGSGHFEQYFVYDLVPHIDRNFRTAADRRHRVLSGLSMGGFGACYLALRHPDLFGAAASLSGALGSTAEFGEKEFARSNFGRIVGPAGGPYARERDLYRLAESKIGSPDRPALYFNCGVEDYLHPMNMAFKRHLDAIGYPYRYEEFAGEHNWAYWTGHLPDALRFLEDWFAGQSHVGS
ncbi:alpha/beta hydrolase [Paenibacillus hamazuiensis]|uniref:alpha/beta hydrolase n=1 Tax=Paenibacillus hamazuiensis TaxID=2936508 RepID=UPI00200BA3FE|nr:alpha/beta fold hydrolase [Paenibacillus hamazuiensis]